MRMMDEGGNSLPLKEFLRSSEEGERGLSFSPSDAVGVVYGTLYSLGSGFVRWFYSTERAVNLHARGFANTVCIAETRSEMLNAVCRHSLHGKQLCLHCTANCKQCQRCTAPRCKQY